ncbi:MAG: GDSL-type esterase/lipase family protein [Fimbriimonas sp.]
MATPKALTNADLDPEVLALASGDWGKQDPSSHLPGYFNEAPDEWLERHHRFNTRASEGNVEVLFIGDSITEGWAGEAGAALWNEHFASLPAANFGIGGDRTQQLLWRIDNGNLDGISPSVVVLLIGVNNLWPQSHTAEEVAAGIQAVIARIQVKLPDAVILHYGIFPTMELPDHVIRGDVLAINAISARHADGERVRYIDLGPQFLQQDGSISADVMPDFCHLAPSAYAIWAESLLSQLADMGVSR